MAPETTPLTSMAPSAMPKTMKSRLFWLLIEPMPSRTVTTM